MEKGLKKKKYLSLLIIVFWVVLVGVLLFNSPSLSKLVAKKGGIQLPNDYSKKIETLINSNNKFNSDDSYIAVFHNDNGLTEIDKDNIKNTLENLDKDKESVYVKSVTDSFKTSKLKSQLVSSNNKTIMALLTIDPKGESVSTISNAIGNKIKTDGVKTYLTGENLIEQDVNIAAQKGLNKTQTITVIFIFVVLILLFKSIVTPFIPLLTVGISYLGAQSVVAILADKFNFPLSNYTQIFMICIMFGIGTDYSILLLNRFKEEIAGGSNRVDAVKTTFKTAGKTVLSSAMPVFVVFASLNFIEFNLYRSAVAVAIGIIFLIAALFTIFPAVMLLLGKNLFWPVRGEIKVEQNKLWGKLGSTAFIKPIPVLVAIAIILAGPIFFNDFKESYNNINEIGDSYSAKAGFNVVANDFGIGNASPMSIYIENDEDMRKPEYVALMEKISTNIKNSNGDVKEVLSVTRPTGTRLDEIYVNDQASIVHSGIDKANDGLNKINGGLKDASKQIGESKGKIKDAENGTEKLQSGTLKTKEGVEELNVALGELVNSINEEHNGANEIKNKVDAAREKVNALLLSNAKILKVFNTINEKGQNILNNSNKALSTLNNSKALENDKKEMENTISTIKNDICEYVKLHPEAKNDKNLEKLNNDIEKILNSNSTKDDLEKLRKNLNDDINLLNGALKDLNNKKDEVINQLNEINKGANELSAGLDALDNGLSKSLNGGKEIKGKVPEIENALTEIYNGQSTIKKGFEEFGSQINELESGLNDGANGIEEVTKGLKYANGFINDWANLSYSISGINVPIEIFSNSEFKQSLDQYISNDGKIAEINVITNKNPYSEDAVNLVPNIQSIVNESVKGTKLENANIGVGGIASTTYETEKMANKDYDKAVIFVIIGVTMALILILQSLVMPLYLMVSLVATYFTSISIVQIIVQKIMGYPGISWITSFFGFVVLMALGIDYSIFIMTRFNQDKEPDMKKRIVKTMISMGGVIISAVIILSGTFAALLPSGVLSLIEISMVVLTGILLYVVVILPLFIPAMVRIFGKANWWPFNRAINKSVEGDSNLEK